MESKSFAEGPSPTDPAVPLTAPWRRRAWSFLALVALLGLGLGILATLKRGPAAPSGPIQSWTQAETKEALGHYLQAHLRDPGFSWKVLTINKGQNYWSVAKGAGLNVDGLVGYNLDMEHLNAYVGRALLVGNLEGTLHQVQAGETLASVAKDYSVEPAVLRQANRLSWLGLRAGDVLFVPKGEPRQLTPEMTQLFANRHFIRSPLAGKYTSLLGVRTDPFTGNYRVHNGVDIKAAFNSLVAAAADGKVSLAGWNGGFGKCVIIEHANGFRTLYGHLNVILVKPGQEVKQYQYIGKVGKTGRTTGPHLHFSIWKNGKLQNPLKYLW